MKRYLLFEYDHGGPNNIIIAFRFILFIAKFFNLILVYLQHNQYHFEGYMPTGTDFESKLT